VGKRWAGQLGMRRYMENFIVGNALRRLLGNVPIVGQKNKEFPFGMIKG
jgi:hypothetical protein